MGGQGISTSTTIKVKKRNKLPGISATQKSVADFFTKRKVKDDHLESVPGFCGDEESSMWCTQDNDIYLHEASLEKQFRLEMVRMCKIQWAVGVSKVPIV